MSEQTATPTTAAQPQKMSWDAPDGKHYEGSPEELFKIASERYNNLYPQYDTLKSENAQFRQQQELIAQATRGQEPPSDKFSNQKYWELMQTNPLEAQRYANQFDPEYQRAVTDLRVTRQNQEAAIFKASNPNFEANEANVEKLAQICNNLFPNSEVLTAQQMTAAYAYMSKQAPKPAETTTAPPVPPASTVSGTQTTPDWMNMNQDQLKAYILQLEQQAR